MARILLDPNDQPLIGGTNDLVFNSAGAENVRIAAGSTTTVYGFQRGGETIQLSGPASSYTITASGANVLITGQDGSVLKLTAGSTAGTILFGDGADSRSLSIVGGQVHLGDQTLANGAATPVTPGAGTYAIAPADGQVFHDEGTTVTFTITRTTATNAETLVYSVSGDTNGGTVNPAIGGEDFLNGGGTVSFAAGETTKTITVQLVGDNLVEGAEGYKVTIFKGASVVAAVAGLINDAVDTNSYTLTNNIDVKTANVFNSQPVYTPGGNDFINSLQDEDVLTGTGANPTLNVTLGSVNDGAESVVAPVLNNIQTVNVGITGNAGGINFQDATGLQELNLNRLTQTNGAAWFEDLDRTTNKLSVNNVTRGGDVHFHYREEVLTGTDETLDLSVNNARVADLHLTADADGGADEGYFFETINLTTTGNNDIDELRIQSNGREDALNGFADGTTRQVLNIVAQGTPNSGSLEINHLGGDNGIGDSGLDEITIEANARVDIAKDKLVPLDDSNDGISTPDLEKVTITGAANVTIDGLDTTKQASGVTLTVDASAMTGNLRLGVQSASDGNSSSTYAYRTDKDLSVISGSGNDEIRTYGVLAGDISTGEGNDIVAIRNNTNSDVADVEGVSTIDAGNGDNVVSARDLLATAGDFNQTANTGYDDVTAARIVTGSGNDIVTVRDLQSGQDWDNKSLTDANADDLYVQVGARIETGAGDDIVSFRRVAEGASVDTGADDDIVNVDINRIPPGASHTVLAGDTNPDVVAIAPGAGTTKEVTAGEVADRLGAVVDMGDGEDIANFAETLSLNANTVTIVGRDAELRSAETVNVTALDTVIVTTTTSKADQDGVTSGVQDDINANVLGTKTLNLTIADQINAATATATGLTQNDGWEVGALIQADVMRFDSALEAINLVSEEKALLTTAALETYRAGTTTAFTLQNLREEIALSLRAHEATGVSAGALVDDTLLAIDTTTGVVSTPGSAADVILNLDYDGARALNNFAELLAEAAAPGQSFDIDLHINQTTTDTAATNAAGNNGNDASTTDDDAMQIENFAIKFADGESHSIDANGFGDVAFRGAGLRPAAVAGDVSSTASTSFTVWSAAAAGKTIAIDAVNADTIRVLNADGSVVTAANVVLRVDASNNYTIQTGSGSDTIDMRADDVRSDDVSTPLDRADRIDAGAGRDTLIVNGTDSLGTNNNIEGGVSSTIIDDDVFAGLRGIEKILVDGDYTGVGAKSLDITLDEEAKATGVDTIALVGTYEQELNLEIGNNFVVATGADNANGQLTSADSALVVDASLHTGWTRLNIESKDDDTDIQHVNLDVRIDSDGGAQVNLVNSGDEDAQVEFRVYTADENDSLTISSTNAGNADGLVDINVTTGSFDKLIVLEGEGYDNGVAEGVMGSVVIDTAWTGTAFEVDASALLDTDLNSATGGLNITASAGETAKLTLRGTQNDDIVTGGQGADLIEGGAGVDVLTGDEVINQQELEVVTFAATYDAGDVITVTHDGDMVQAVIGMDGVTGAAVAAAFASYGDVGIDIVGDNILMSGSLFFGSLVGDTTSDAATRQLRIKGAVAGTDYAVSATVDNSNDNVQQGQTLSGVGDGTIDAQVVFNGTTYTIADPDNAADYAALATAVTDLNGTFTLDAGVGNAGTNGFTITGPASGAAFPLVTATTHGVLAYMPGDAGNDQANPQVVTETLARTVLGDADVIHGGAGDDVIAGLKGGDTLDGGDGVDTLDYTLSLQGVNVDLAANTASGGDAQGDIISNFENVWGSAYNDVLIGNGDANLLDGGRGDDVLSGGAGDDTLLAGDGADTVTGGLGSDYIDLGNADGAQDTVVFGSGDGFDTIVNFEAGTDKIQLTGFADRDLIPGSLLHQAGTNTNDAISGNNTELLVVSGAVVGAGTEQADIANALGAAFNLSSLADGKVLFSVSNGADSWVGIYTDNGADDVIQASEIEVLGHFSGSLVTQADFWLPAV